MKRLFAAALAFIMAFTLTANAMAPNAMVPNDTGQSQPQFIDRVAPADKNAVAKDLASLQSVGFDANSFDTYRKTEKGMAYELPIDDKVISEITIIKDSGGELILDIVEGPLHDVLEYTDDGRIILNGYEIKISEVITTSDETSQALLPNVIVDSYFENRPANYPASSYGSASLYYQSASVSLGTYLVSITTSALASTLFTCVVASGDLLAALTSIVGGAVFGTALAVEMKNLAQTMCPDSAFFSFKINRRMGPQNTIDGSFNKFEGDFYSSKNFKNFCASRELWHIRENY